MYLRKSLLIALLLIALPACEIAKSKPTTEYSTLDLIQDELESGQEKQTDTHAAESLDDALLPELNAVEVEVSAEDKFDISVHRMDAKTFFLSLVKGTPYNIVVHPDVSGKISLDLRQVTLEQVLDTVRSMYGLAYKRNGNIYKIYANGLQTQMFHINYLNVARDGESSMSVSAGQVSDLAGDGKGDKKDGARGVTRQEGTRISTSTSTDFWKQLKTTLSLFVANNAGQDIIISPQTGIVVVRALPDELVTIEKYLEKSQLILKRQVVIEAKILEVALNDGFQSGINWQALGQHGSNSNKSVTTRVGSSPIANVADLVDPLKIGGAFRLNASLNDFTAVIQLLESQGNVQVLSSPKISTINNQKAVIKVGSDEFFVTEITNNTTISGNNTQTNPSVELTPFFSGIALDVTPQISEEDEVILHIHPSISRVTESTKTIRISPTQDLELPLATSSIRETDSIVYAKTGEIVVIGGLMSSRSEESDSGAPGLQSVPLLGNLFKQKSRSFKKSELVILLKPRIIDADGWGQELGNNAELFNQMRKQLDIPARRSKP